MGRTSESFSPEPRLLGGAILWLRQHGVSAGTVAAVFGVSENYIHVLASRARTKKQSRQPSRDPIVLNKLTGRELRKALGIRPADEGFSPQPHQAIKIEKLRDEWATLRTVVHGGHDLLGTAQSLGRFEPQLGNFAQLSHIRAKAELLVLRAWCLSHGGRSLSAIRMARRASLFGQLAYAESLDPSDLRFVRDALLASTNAHLLRHEPEAAAAHLDSVEQVSLLTKDDLGSEYWRQRGVVAFQVGTDQDAAPFFHRSGLAATSDRATRSAVQIDYTSLRHMAFGDGPDLDASYAHRQAAVAFYGSETIQASVANHWFCASALMTDSATERRLADDVLRENASCASRFAHQATLHWLLNRTPQLGLGNGVRRQWIRWLLYANAYASM